MISKDLYLFLLPLNNKNKNISIQRALYSQRSLVWKLRQENSRKENRANVRLVEHIHAVLHCWKASIGIYKTNLKKHMKKLSIQELFFIKQLFFKVMLLFRSISVSKPWFLYYLQQLLPLSVDLCRSNIPWQRAIYYKLEVYLRFSLGSSTSVFLEYLYYNLLKTNLTLFLKLNILLNPLSINEKSIIQSPKLSALFPEQFLFSLSTIHHLVSLILPPWYATNALFSSLIGVISLHVRSNEGLEFL